MNAIQALSQLSYTPIGERFLYLIVLEGCICYKPGSQLSYTPIGERFLYLIVLEGCICYKPGSQLSYTPIGRRTYQRY